MKSQMTGPEHYRAGMEKMAQASHLDPQGSEQEYRMHAAVVAEAQAHFTAMQALAFGVMVIDADVDGVTEDWEKLIVSRPVVDAG